MVRKHAPDARPAPARPPAPPAGAAGGRGYSPPPCQLFSSTAPRRTLPVSHSAKGGAGGSVGRGGFDAEAALVGQLRRRLLAEQAADAAGGKAPPDAAPPHVRRRAAELLARLRRVAPARLLADAGDAALLLDARGLAELRPHDRPGLLVLRLTAAGAAGRDDDAHTARGGSGRA